MATIRQNLDIEQFEGFREFLKENPEKVRLDLEVRADYEGQAGRSLVHIGKFAMDGEVVDRSTRHYTLPFGAWREVEETVGQQGPTDRLEPVEVALAACAACLNNSISYNAARLGIDTAGIETTIRQQVDPRVLLAVKGPEDHGSCMGDIEVDIKVTGDVSEEDIATISDLARHSPVYGLITGANTVNHRVEKA